MEVSADYRRNGVIFCEVRCGALGERAAERRCCPQVTHVLSLGENDVLVPRGKAVLQGRAQISEDGPPKGLS